MKYFKLAFAAFIYCSMISMATIASGQSIGGVFNDYTSVSDVDYAAGNKVTVADASPYSVGDKAMLIQMQGADIVVLCMTVRHTVVAEFIIILS